VRGAYGFERDGFEPADLFDNAFAPGELDIVEGLQVVLPDVAAEHEVTLALERIGDLGSMPPECDACRFGTNQAPLSPEIDGNALDHRELDAPDRSEAALKFEQESLELGRILVIQQEAGAQKTMFCSVAACRGLPVDRDRPRALASVSSVGRKLPLRKAHPLPPPCKSCGEFT
jgi:hypothetical protein